MSYKSCGCLTSLVRVSQHEQEPTFGSVQLLILLLLSCGISRYVWASCHLLHFSNRCSSYSLFIFGWGLHIMGRLVMHYQYVVELIQYEVNGIPAYCS